MGLSFHVFRRSKRRATRRLRSIPIRCSCDGLSRRGCALLCCEDAGYQAIDVRATRARPCSAVIPLFFRQGLRLSVINHGTIRRSFPAKALRRSLHFHSSVAFMRVANLPIKGFRRTLTTAVLFLELRTIKGLRNRNTQALKVTRRVRLTRVRDPSGLMYLFGVHFHLATHPRGSIGASGNVKRRDLSTLRFSNGGNYNVASIRRLRRFITATLRKGVRVKRRHAQEDARIRRLVNRRVKFSKKCTMANCSLRAIGNFRRVRGALPNKLTRVASIRSYSSCLASTFNYDLFYLYRRFNGATIATSTANGEGNAMNTVVIASILRFRRRAHAITAKAQERRLASIPYCRNIQLVNNLNCVTPNQPRERPFFRVTWGISFLFHSRGRIGAFSIQSLSQFRLNVAPYRRSGDSKVLPRRAIGNLPTFIINRFNRQANIRRASINLLSNARHPCTRLFRLASSNKNLHGVRLATRNMVGNFLSFGCEYGTRGSSG